MKNWCYFLVLGFPFWLHAESLETHYLAKISRAKTPAEVTRLSKAYSDLKEARIACRIQLRRRTLPSACYDSLKGEIKLGMHGSTTRRKQLLSKLDEKCAETAADIYLSGHSVPRADGISPYCARKVNEARKIHAYRNETREYWSEN